ncbi:hypothetical protein RA210_U80123 [Rubrivivax sp. A210]|nr:hypothetical protein RA210_U80123 [Rubrivivax sp. A210]
MAFALAQARPGIKRSRLILSKRGPAVNP